MSKNIENNFFRVVIKGAFLSLIISLIGVLIFAIFVKVSYLNSGVIKTVNQFIKTIAIFLSCFFTIRESMGLIKGVVTGVLGVTITFLVFSLIGGNLSFGLPFIVDLVFGAIIGGLSGIVSVNIKG